MEICGKVSSVVVPAIGSGVDRLCCDQMIYLNKKNDGTKNFSLLGCHWNEG